jgi:hypothetical protein
MQPGDPVREVVLDGLKYRLGGVAKTTIPATWRHLVSGGAVVKFVRGQLCLGALLGTWPTSVHVHIRRNPFATIASILRAPNWGPGTEQPLDLKALCRCVADGRSEVFANWEPLIERFAGAEQGVRIALYWAMLESAVQCKVAKFPHRCLTIRYEDMPLTGWKEVRHLLRSHGHPILDSHTPTTTDSRTTQVGRKGLSHDERVSSWKSELPTRTIDAICEVLDASNYDEVTGGFREQAVCR